MVSKHAKKSEGIQQLSWYAQIPDNSCTYVNNIVKVLQFSHVDVGPNQVHLLSLLIDLFICSFCSWIRDWTGNRCYRQQNVTDSKMLQTAKCYREPLANTYTIISPLNTDHRPNATQQHSAFGLNNLLKQQDLSLLKQLALLVSHNTE